MVQIALESQKYSENESFWRGMDYPTAVLAGSLFLAEDEFFLRSKQRCSESNWIQMSPIVVILSSKISLKGSYGG